MPSFVGFLVRKITTNAIGSRTILHISPNRFTKPRA
jgi:hypothetical protein